ncbi:MAG: hypothetical protein MMC23_002568 [Stictis urceolatum]|nr:hypothetical protein [Stictis urceolata]
MGKKKRNHPDIEEILSRPWCYYCERDFDDLKILINHQRAKHFMCERCGRRLNTAGGLSVHMNQVHKEQLNQIDNALPNRANLDVEIFGMEGIPEDVTQAHNQRVLSNYAQAEAERRAVTGNPAPGGSSQGSAPKKPKFESPSEMKKRLAEHKAKKAAEEAAAANAPQNGAGVLQAEGNGPPSPAFGQAPYASTSPYPGQQMPYGAPPGNTVYGNSPQPYGQPNPQFAPQQQPPQFQPQPQGFNGPAPPYGQPSFSPTQQYPQPGFQPPPFQAGPQPFPSGPPRPSGANTPPTQHRVQTPPQGMQSAQRQNSLPTAPGLPQRPSFNAPNVNAIQMQQMHQGQLPSPPNVPYNAQTPSISTPPQNGAATTPAPQAQLPAESAPTEKPEGKQSGQQKEKKSKKDKDKPIKLVWSDDEVSPEEKMASLPRYAFDPKDREQTVMGTVEAAVTATVSGYEEGPRYDR